LYSSIRSILTAEFDEALVAKARALAALVEEEDGEVEAEFASYPSAEFTRPDRPEYYLLRTVEGEVLARSPRLPSTTLIKATSPGNSPSLCTASLPDGRLGRYVVIQFEPRAEKRRKHPQPLILAVGKDVLDLNHTLDRLKLLFSAVGVFGIATLCVLLTTAVRSGLTPLARVASRIDSLDAGNLSQRLSIEGVPTELLPVVGRLNELLQRLEGAFARERAFTADVAHDLRTPLSALRTTLEIALSRERAQAEYRTAISESLAVAQDMQCMTDSLLALARAEAGQTKIERKTVDLQPLLLLAAWRGYEARAAGRNLQVATHVPPALQVSTDQGQLSLVLNQLIENAVSHAATGGEVRIDASTVNDHIRIEIANTGNTLSSQDVAHVFERFWRGDKSRTQPGLHSGLGLSLAKRITELLGGTIQAEVAGNWFKIALELPAQT
jgi:two-component system sensor histidine kinase QseC